MKKTKEECLLMNGVMAYDLGKVEKQVMKAMDDYADDAVTEALCIHAVSGRSEQLHLCPVCNEKAGKSYLLSKLPTICQKCDHAWNMA